MSKYDWSNVPKEVQWISTDWEGWKTYHLKKPSKTDFDFVSDEAGGCYDLLSKNEFQGSWEDSLEERPK